MDGRKLTISDLKRLFADREEESLLLEFKSCDELRVGSNYRDKKGDTQTRSRDDVINELSKDVSALLNAAGGCIIYGIREKKSRADSLDEKAYTAVDNLTLEKLIDWLRAYIQPPPDVSAYRVFANPDDENSSWYFVIQVEQGQQAYMARDNRFYKRVGAIVKPMEQYEVVDAMNRSKGALLDIKWDIYPYQPQYQGWRGMQLKPSITRKNLISSEHGALRLTIGWPMRFASGWRNFGLFPWEAGLSLEGYDDTPKAAEATIRWGVHQGGVVYPGDWYNFNRKSIDLEVPLLTQSSTFLFQVELFTAYALPQKRLYAIQNMLSGEPQVLIVDGNSYYEVVDMFWETFHLAHENGSVSS